ncbi:hypothetical protein PHMEG_00012405 [Phytophthora megakarya]|uniref:Reverse transcriptase n=1 Tax=Phytophthora megakarya TaxID=4795 RepID=A0A225WBD5_9STRA|nr:hypothetical protein PHMEG_00012405 [Phytophthora megakarya]
MDDLRWFKAVLQRPDHFSSIPIAEFSDLVEPDIEVYMDASGDGFCVLEFLRKLFLRQRFSEVEVASVPINIRELRSAVLAVLHWGPMWVRAAHEWANRRSSRHPTAQLYNRLLSLAEFQYNLTCSASHIPENLNVMVDAGSRAWVETASMTLKWSKLSASWMQVIIDPKFENLSTLWDRCCMATPWQALPLPNIDNTGINGALSHG